MKPESRGVTSLRQLKGSIQPVHGYPAEKDVRTSGVEKLIIEGPYSYIRALLHKSLLKLIVFTVCEYEYMNMDPLNYRAGYVAT